jgi:predicted transcriptional regulator
MKTETKARKYSSPLLKQVLSEVSKIEKKQNANKYSVATKLVQLLELRGWNKTTFAEKVNRHPSEITKWLSGTHNFTIDTLTEIADTFKISIAELF